MTTGVLSYYAIKKGMDIVIGVTLALSALTVALNLYCEIKKGNGDE